MTCDDAPFSRFPGLPAPQASEARKREVEELLRRAGELFAYVTTLCGRAADEAEADVVYAWIQGNYPDDVKRFGRAFITGLRRAQRKIFRTDATGNLMDDSTTMTWLRTMKSQCREHIAAKERLLAEFRAGTPKPPTWN